MASCIDGSGVNSAKVNVAIRVRPLISKEIVTGAKSRWKTDGQTIQQMNPVTKSPTRGSSSYTFDYAFGPETETTEIYKTVVAPIVEKSFQGFNGTILCYGQTSSGKTHTLYGSQEDPGIISLMADDLFKRIRDRKRVYYIRVGLLEIYNENMTDLLNDNSPVEDMEVGGVVVPKNLTEIEVVSPEQILDAARRVQLERKVGETIMNQQSSRSHTIVRIVVESAPSLGEAKNADEEKIKDSDKDSNNNDLHLTTAVLNFVDLAGSEKASKTSNNGERFTESNYINKSLTSLSKVVMELSKTKAIPNTATSVSTPTISRRSKVDGSTSTPSRSSSKQPYINFRDSKLTRILQSSLNGNAYVTMICNLTPASVPESHSTLRFAKAAKEIKTDPTQNRKLLQIGNEYEMKISELELRLRQKSAEFEKLQSQLFVMQSFQRVCSPVTQTKEQQKPQKGNIRKKNCCHSHMSAHQISKNSSFDFSLTPHGRKEDRSKKLSSMPCVSIPFAEWASTKKESKKIIVERDSLKTKLVAAEVSEKLLLKENEELKSQLEANEKEKHRLAEDILGLTSKKEELSALVASSNKSLVTTENVLNSTRQKLTLTENKRENLSNKLENVKKCLIHAKQENERLSEILNATEQLNETLSSNLNDANERLSEVENENERLSSNLNTMNQRLLIAEKENERLLEETIPINLDESCNSNISQGKSFRSFGIQASCETYNTGYMNYLRNYRDNQIKLCQNNENGKLIVRIKDLESQIECLKSETSGNVGNSIIPEKEEVQEKVVEKTDKEIQYSPVKNKCRFPSFLVPWTSLT